MSGVPTDEERLWAAEKRSFVADAQDDSTDEREAAADAMEALIDAREAELDEFSQRLEAKALALGLPISPEEQPLGTGSVARAKARAQRGAARAERDQARRQLGTASASLAQRGDDRLVASPPLLLAAQFAELASFLYTSNSLSEVLDRIARAAVLTVPGCVHASVSICDAAGCRTVTATDELAAAVDQAQYAVGEGPCLDALRLPQAYAQAFPDERWPALADRPLAFGVHSLLAYHIDTRWPGDPAADGQDLPCAGALNLFGARPDAFDQEAREMGLILASHASIATHAVGRRSSLEGLSRNLQEALSARDVIGQAKGILMERLRIPPDRAFDVLRSSSQQLNIKLREVARRLAETGELPRPDNR